MGEPELREHGARRRGAEALDEILAQQPHRDGVEQQRALTREADHPASGVELEELLVVQIVRAHSTDLIKMIGKVPHLDGLAPAPA